MPGMSRDPGEFTGVSAGAGEGAGVGEGVGEGSGSAGFSDGNNAAGAVSNLPISPSRPEFSGGFAGAADSPAGGVAGCGVCADAIDETIANSMAARKPAVSQARNDRYVFIAQVQV